MSISSPTIMPTGVSTGIGSWPGNDYARDMNAAVGIVFDVHTDLPYLPEIIDAPQFNMIGRGVATLTDFALEESIQGWRIRPGASSQISRIQRLTQERWQRDIDALAKAAEGYTGWVKLQIVGPWTLAAAIDLPRGEKALSDLGAVKDLTQSLGDGFSQLLAEISTRLPNLQGIIVQLDEPFLPAALEGTIASASGFRRYTNIPAETAIDGLKTVRESMRPRSNVDMKYVGHCCAKNPPLSVFDSAGLDAISADFRVWDVDETAVLDRLAELIDRGRNLWLGISPGAVSDYEKTLTYETVKLHSSRIVKWWQRLGFSPTSITDHVVITPACGLENAKNSENAAMISRWIRDISRDLSEVG